MCVFMIKISDLDMTMCFVSLFPNMKKDSEQKKDRKEVMEHEREIC